MHLQHQLKLDSFTASCHLQSCASLRHDYVHSCTCVSCVVGCADVMPWMNVFCPAPTDAWVRTKPEGKQGNVWTEESV